jgi:hypothetical protein
MNHIISEIVDYCIILISFMAMKGVESSVTDIIIGCHLMNFIHGENVEYIRMSQDLAYFPFILVGIA